MNKGSTRVTIRIGDEMLALVHDALERRNQNPTLEEWCLTDFVMQAIAEKLAKGQRSRKEETQVRQQKVDPFMPREVSDE